MFIKIKYDKENKISLLYNANKKKQFWNKNEHGEHVNIKRALLQWNKLHTDVNVPYTGVFKRTSRHSILRSRGALIQPLRRKLPFESDTDSFFENQLNEAALCTGELPPFFASNLFFNFHRVYIAAIYSQFGVTDLDRRNKYWSITQNIVG
jgi:hypothetical protein